MATQSVDAYVESLPEEILDVGRKLRAVIDAGLPTADVVMWHGHPTWMIGKVPVALLKGYTKYVTFGLFNGQRVDDSTSRLHPGAREMAVVKVSRIDDVDDATFATWLHQAQELVET